MKKRLATLAIVGAMAVSAAAPMSVFAADTNVYYVAGAETPGGSGSGYYVTIPSDITFTDENVAGSQVLELKKLDSATLPANLKVDVTVSSTNDGQLKNATAAPSAGLDYQVEYVGQTGSSTAGNGTLATGTSTGVAVGSFTGEGTLTGEATLLETAEDAGITVANGTVFNDVLTYTITQATP